MFARKRKTLFLSYRRDDNSGYVRQLQEDLQRYFGQDSVFRDVEDIGGGQPWKKALSDSLAQSAALIVVIGPRWEQIWRERASDDEDNDYVVFELNRARELGLPVIPVTINGTDLSSDLDLGSIAWLKDNQFHDITDRQGRWDHDVLGLVTILERHTALVRRKQAASSGGRKKYLLIPAALAVLAAIGLLQEQKNSPELGGAIPDLQPGQIVATQSLPQAPDQVDMSTSAELQDYSASQTASAISPQASSSAFPDISGFWQDDIGEFYEIGQVMADGSFFVSTAQHTAVGQFIPEMPRKFRINAKGLGHGEYSVSFDNSTMTGWFYLAATGETDYGMLWRASESGQ